MEWLLNQQTALLLRIKLIDSFKWYKILKNVRKIVFHYLLLFINDKFLTWTKLEQKFNRPLNIMKKKTVVIKSLIKNRRIKRLIFFQIIKFSSHIGKKYYEYFNIILSLQGLNLKIKSVIFHSPKTAINFKTKYNEKFHLVRYCSLFIKIFQNSNVY